jgi:hypothetical protein
MATVMPVAERWVSIGTLPAAGAYTDRVRVPLLTLEETTDRALLQPVTVTTELCFRTDPFCPTNHF